MAAKPTKKRPRTIKSAEGKLGKAKRAAKSGVRARAKASDLLKTDELEARQESIGKQRRSGGPALDAKPSGRVKVPKVPETVAEGPIGKKKRAKKRRND